MLLKCIKVSMIDILKPVNYDKLAQVNCKRVY